MSEHFIVAVDRGRLRIYSESNTFGCFPPAMQLVASTEFERDPERYTDRAMRVRRLGSSEDRPKAAPPPRRAAVRRDELRLQARQVAAQLKQFWRRHPNASWDLAASPTLYRAIMDELSPEVLRRLKRVYAHELLPLGVAPASAVPPPNGNYAPA